MQVMDGYQATRKIREIGDYQHVPIIALTDDAQDGSKDKSFNAGMNSHMNKPVELDILY